MTPTEHAAAKLIAGAKSGRAARHEEQRRACLSGAFGSVRASMKNSLPMLALAMKAFSPLI